jgi:hypothetical protein
MSGKTSNKPFCFLNQETDFRGSVRNLNRCLGWGIKPTYCNYLKILRIRDMLRVCMLYVGLLRKDVPDFIVLDQRLAVHH